VASPGKDVTVVVSAATATASAPTPTPTIVVSAPAATAMASVGAAVVVGPSAVLAYALVEPHPHLLADHHDPIALATDAGLLLVVMFVSGRIVVSGVLGRPSG
jgi:hypothetical protein